MNIKEMNSRPTAISNIPKTLDRYIPTYQLSKFGLLYVVFPHANPPGPLHDSLSSSARSKYGFQRRKIHPKFYQYFFDLTVSFLEDAGKPKRRLFDTSLAS
jgi:hypothetical protein